MAFSQNGGAHVSHKASLQPRRTRSISGSKPTLNEGRPEIGTSNENVTTLPLRRKKSVTFDDCMGSDEVREQLGLASKNNGREWSGVFEEPAQGEFRGHKITGVSGQSSSAKQPIMQPRDHSEHHQFQPTLEPILSVSSSRRNSIPSTNQQRSKKRPQLDRETSKKKEGEKLESEEQSGTVRRRNHKHTMSKDDQLVVRAANPRTGVVTPGVLSAANSFEGVEELKAKSSGRWRQGENGWKFSQTTPTGSPFEAPRQLADVRLLRTPPKLTAERLNHGANRETRSYLVTAGVSHAGSSPATSTIPTPTGVLGTFLLTPQNGVGLKRAPCETDTEAKIRRKPIASPAQETYTEPRARQHQRTHNTSASNDTVIVRPFANDQSRSFSVPIPKQKTYFSPDDVGVDLKAFPTEPPAVPPENFYPKSESHGPQFQQSDHFLDKRPDWVEDVPDFALMNVRTSGREKTLPDRPMSTGPSQLPHLSQQNIDQGQRTAAILERTRGLSGARGGNPNYPYMRLPMKRYQIGSERNLSNGPVRIHDSFRPTRFSGQRPPRSDSARVQGPRQTTSTTDCARTRMDAGDIFTSLRETTSTSTGMNIGITTTSMPRTRQYRMPLQPHLLDKNTSVNSSILMPTIPPPQIQSRGMSRPMMPERAEGMQNVPTVSPNRPLETATDMVNRHQWRMPGMRESAAGEEKSIATGTDIEMGVGKLPNVPVTVGGGADRGIDRTRELHHPVENGLENGTAAREESVQQNGLMRKCSRWRNGYVESGGKTPGIGGRIRMSERLRAPVLGSFADGTDQSLSTTLENDERDHGACCPDCCEVEDCHEGCLGHPSPIVDDGGDGSSPRSGVSLDSGTTVTEDNPGIFEKAQESPRKKLASLKATLRTIDQTPLPRRSRFTTSQKNSTSPASFWGGDGAGGATGAIEAAKAALGFKKNKNERQGRKRKGRQRSDTEPIPIPSDVWGDVGVSGANEGRRMIVRIPRTMTGSEIGGSSSGSGSGMWGTARSRNASGASLRSIEVPNGIPFVWEIVCMPLEAGWMYWSSHPELQRYVLQGGEKVVEMCGVVGKTGGMVLRVAYVYSKTGRVKWGREERRVELGWDVGRSLLYLGVLMSLAVVGVRVVGFAFGLLKWFGVVVNVVSWVFRW